jgi:hypothetical protein
MEAIITFFNGAIIASLCILAFGIVYYLRHRHHHAQNL